MDIAIWLQQIGLSQYATAFRDNDVDFRILPGLTGDDLREIGVLSVGHRRLLMQAIGRLAEAPAVPRQGAFVEPGGAEGAPAASAERRRLTVMFVDLVGSTMLMRRHDPEDVRDILHRYQGLVAGEIARVEGYLAKFMGDGVLAYFGWPRAHEDDAERAVRAGLAITNAMAQLRLLDGELLACRIGIATGPVVVGDLIGEGRSREEAVVGDTPNLAARLQALAPANGVLLSHPTRQLVGRLFTLVPLGKVELKGFEATQTVWRVVGEARSRSRFEARQGATASPMVGRDQELALLRERWAQAKQGEGQAVLLVGEAGIGKSRLVEALRNDIGSEATLVHWQASPLHRATSLRPVMEDLLEHDEAATVETLEARLMESGVDLQQAVPLLSAHAGISLSAAYPPLEIASEAQRPKLLQMLLQHFLGLAKRQPLLLLFEDTHWADATTLELTRLLLQRLTKGAVLLVITSRPENLPALESQSHLTRLTLNRLSRSAVAEIVMRLIPENRAAGLVETIVSRTDGVPLFVEELSKAIAESDGEQAADETELDVPASLHDTLMARLDRLPTAKELAQLAACIGREIDHRLLRSVADYPEAELTLQLAELCDAELLFRHGTPPDLSYSFKHALVRDAAYESQLKSTRRATHGRILAALERGMVEAEGERLGYHAAGARLWGKALHYYGSAGKAAFSRASNEEGLALVAKAFESGERLHGDRDAAVAMIDLRTARGWAYLSMGETQRMLEELSEAEASAAGLGLTQLTCQLRTQRTHVESIFGESAERALEHGSAALDLAERVGDPNLLSAVRFVLGHASLVAGDYRAAIEYLEVDAEASQQGLRMAGVGSSGTLAVDILACLGDAHAQLGQWDAAWRRGAEARAVALESGSLWDMVVANYHQTRALLAAGDADAALPLIDQAIEYCNRAGLRFGRPWHLANLGEVHRMNGRPDEAIPLLDRAISDCAELGLKYPRGHAHLSKAEACIDMRRADAGSVTEEALAFVRSHRHQAFEASALRLLATISTPALAAQHLGDARRIAEALRLSLDRAKISELQTKLTPAN